METLPSQFDDALAHIEINGRKRERAVAAHTEIREWLETDATLVSWGIDTVLIGSYARNTGIYPGKDVDVFAKLTALDVRVNPQEVFDTVAAMLRRKYDDRAEQQNRSVRVSFDTDGDGFSVDVVPAVPTAQHWAIPQRDRTLWMSADLGARWVETDPERLGNLTAARNVSPQVGTRGAYVPVVKLVRQVRRHHMADAKPGGLYFELLTYWAFEDGMTGASFAELLVASLNSLAAQLASGAIVIDPALGTPVSPAPDSQELASAATLFGQLASRAEKALKASRCPAAVLWREIIGDNERGECFPLPPGCDAEGRELAPVTAVMSTGSRQPSGFATGLDT